MLLLSLVLASDLANTQISQTSVAVSIRRWLPVQHPLDGPSDGGGALPILQLPARRAGADAAALG